MRHLSPSLTLVLSCRASVACAEQAIYEFVIPIHYRLRALEAESDAPSDLGGIDSWLENRQGVQRVDGHVTTLSAADLPDERTCLVFEHAPYVSGPRGV